MADREGPRVEIVDVVRRWESGNRANGEAASTPSPSAVVSAEPNSADPVAASVRTAASSGLRRRANSSR